VHALREIELRLAGNDRSEVKDHVGAARDRAACGGWIGDVTCGCIHLAREILRPLRRADVDKRKPVD
jgi:hypothetical protein